MKKLKEKMEYCILRLEVHWKGFPVSRQRFLTKIFFAGYVLMTVIVIINICISTGQRNNTMSIHHIEGIAKRPIEKSSEHIHTTTSSTKK